jgi:hypothetical protein
MIRLDHRFSRAALQIALADLSANDKRPADLSVNDKRPADLSANDKRVVTIEDKVRLEKSCLSE